MVVWINGRALEGAALAAFWVAIGVAAVACLIGALCLIFPKFREFIRGIKF